MSSLVSHHTERGIATITIDSPANRNALSIGLLEDLRSLLAEIAGSDEARAVVLTAAGTTFCSGADLSGPIDEYAGAVGQLLTDLWSFPKPVVTAVNGHVRGGGIGLVAVADVAVAVSRATFCFSEVRLGLVPTMVAVPCVERMTPRSVSRYFLTAEVFSAEAALASGLVTTVTGDDDLAAATAEVTDALRLGEPGSLVQTKAFIRELAGYDVADGFRRATALSASLIGSAASVEGLRAFAEKRPPAWARD
ncbi:MAG: Enoyl-CoA hydratase/isomerase [Actinomycetia bacterium]|nr:Enoyl-CoA hydratase/isomerase [Actinomycetes bacterium]